MTHIILYRNIVHYIGAHRCLLISMQVTAAAWPPARCTATHWSLLITPLHHWPLALNLIFCKHLPSGISQHKYYYYENEVYDWNIILSMIKNYDTKKRPTSWLKRVHDAGHCDKKFHQCQVQKCARLGVHFMHFMLGLAHTWWHFTWAWLVHSLFDPLARSHFTQWLALALVCCTRWCSCARRTHLCSCICRTHQCSCVHRTPVFVCSSYRRCSCVHRILVFVCSSYRRCSCVHHTRRCSCACRTHSCLCVSCPSVFVHLVDVGASVLTGGVVLLVMVVLACSSFNPLAFRSLLYLVALAHSSLCLMMAACSFVLGLVVWACSLF